MSLLPSPLPGIYKDCAHWCLGDLLTGGPRGTYAANGRVKLHLPAGVKGALVGSRLPWMQPVLGTVPTAQTGDKRLICVLLGRPTGSMPTAQPQPSVFQGQ